jgi:AcrR family transcriptional regulator
MEVKERRKKEIVNAARDLFTNFGYKSVSMEQIATKANVAKGTLYLYFHDKEDLFYYIARELIGQMKNFATKVESKNLLVLDELHEIMYNLLKFRREQKFLYTIKQEAMNFKTPSACAVERMIDDEIVSYIKRSLERAMDRGIIKKCNTSILSFVVIRVYTALAFEWEEEHEPLNEEEIAENVKLFLKDGLIIG